METLIRHLAGAPRRLAAAPPVDTIGFLPRKTNWIMERRFRTYNFSFILAGGGVYHYRGRELKINAPCVITQWPGEPMRYGPHESWREVYCMYPATAGSLLKKQKLFSESRPAWEINRMDDVLHEVHRLFDMLTAAAAPEPDRVDQICLGLIVASLLAPPVKPRSGPEQAIHEIAADLAANFEQSPDFTGLARRHGMSLPTFHRHWRRCMPMPPARYHAAQMLREAQRLLVESDAPIKQIAARLGFGDQLYFTKKFSRLTGLAPGEYRRRQRLPLGV